MAAPAPQPTEYHVTLANGDRVSAQGTVAALDSMSGYLTVATSDGQFKTVFRVSEVLYWSGPHALNDGKDVKPVPAPVDTAPQPLK